MVPVWLLDSMKELEPGSRSSMTRCASLLSYMRALLLLCTLLSPTLHAQEMDARIMQLFPKATRIEPKLEQPPVYSVFQLDELIGYAFESNDYSNLDRKSVV